MSCNSTAIQNAADADISLAIQTGFGVPNVTELQLVNSQTGDASQGNVTFVTKQKIGAATNFDIQSTLATVDKSLTLHNTPNQLEKIARWVFGNALSSDFLHLQMLKIWNENTDLDKFFYTITASTSSLVLSKKDKVTTVETTLATIPLPATLAEVVTQINAVENFNASILIGLPTDAWTYEGILDLSSLTLAPASVAQSSTAKISVFSPLVSCPNYATILFELFKGTAESARRADVDALVQSFSIAMPKDDSVSLEIAYLASANKLYEAADITAPTASDPESVYKSTLGSYVIEMLGRVFPSITDVTFSYTANNNPDKGWSGNQLETGVSSFDAESQVSSLLTSDLYAFITKGYTATSSAESKIPTLITITNPNLADKDNNIPFRFMISMPGAKVSQAPNLPLEAGAVIPFNFSLKPTVVGENVDSTGLYFIVIHN